MDRDTTVFSSSPFATRSPVLASLYPAVPSYATSRFLPFGRPAALSVILELRYFDIARAVVSRCPVVVRGVFTRVLTVAFINPFDWERHPSRIRAA